MKARIPKDTTKTPAIVESKEPCNKKGFRRQPTVKDLTEAIKPKIESDFEYMTKQNDNEDAVISTLNAMLEMQYIRRFKPSTHLMKQCVRLCVSSFIKEGIKRKLQRDIKNMLKSGNHSEIEVLNRILSPEYLEDLKPIASDELFKLVNETVNNYVQRRKDEIEDPFLQSVSEYTDGFRFLAEDRLIYSSETGKRRIKKFDDLEQYKRFAELQEMIKLKMQLLKKNEMGAIQELLNDPESRIDDTSRTILRTREKVLIEKGIISEQEI